MSSHRREMKGHTDRFLYLLRNMKSSRRVTLFAKLSSNFFLKKNVFTHSTSYPCSCILSAMKSSGRKSFQSAQSKIPRTDDPHSQVRGVREIDESSPAAEETLQPKSIRNRTGERRLAYYSCLPIICLLSHFNRGN